jgi:hypothetical protein
MLFHVGEHGGELVEEEGEMRARMSGRSRLVREGTYTMYGLAGVIRGVSEVLCKFGLRIRR